MTIRLDKSSRKQPKPIQDNNPAEPDEKFDMSKFKKETIKKTTSERRGPGQPRKNNAYGLVRISDTARDILNCYKQATNQPSQGEAITNAISIAVDSMTPKEKKAFNALLAVKGIEF